MNYLAVLRRDGTYLIQAAEVRSIFRLSPELPHRKTLGSISTIVAKSVARNESAEMALGQSRRLGYRGGISSE
jgi:hypothetical protein